VQLPIRYPFILNVKATRAEALDLPANVLGLVDEAKNRQGTESGAITASTLLASCPAALTPAPAYRPTPPRTFGLVARPVYARHGLASPRAPS
jgi:hypothetical protein